jgi:hypothetical protein
MPSPFPGMDPYLEGPRWLGVHSQLCPEIARQLAPRLRPRYVALTNERFVLDTPEDIGIAPRSIYLDTGVTQASAAVLPQRPGSVSEPPLHLATIMPERVPQVSVEIRDSTERRLVTAIEVLSPVNKRGPGRRDYLRRRRAILLSDAHLIEIDLLREGRRVPMRQRCHRSPISFWSAGPRVGQSWTSGPLFWISPCPPSPSRFCPAIPIPSWISSRP